MKQNTSKVAQGKVPPGSQTVSRLLTRHSAKALLASLMTAALASLPARGANILWVSDASPGSGSGGVFSPAGANYTDSGFVTLLQNAGHNVSRFNSADGQAVLLTQTELDAINTNDLVIIGRGCGSGAFQVGAGTGGGPGQGSNWNAQVTSPLICMSPYLVRTIAANRMGWFQGDVGPDDTPSPLTPASATDPAVEYLFAGVAMSGTNTAQLYAEPMDRNISHILGNPVAGGRTLARVTFAREDNGVIATGQAIADWPAGTVVGGGSNVLAGYRMYFAGGTRESATAPNAIPFYTGRETLTPTGEDVFLRAVQLALNRGVAPTTNSGPAGFVSSPANLTVSQGQAATFNVEVSGAAPRSLAWQRVSDDGVTFTNIPGTDCAFTRSSLTLPSAGLTDHGAKFRVILTDGGGTITSQEAVLTVTPDTVPPVPVSATSLDGLSVVVRWNEAMDFVLGPTTDVGNYSLNGGAGPFVLGIVQGSDDRSVVLSLDAPLGPTASLDVFAGTDLAQNTTTDITSLSVTNYGLSALDIGALNPAGSSTVGAGGSIRLTGGGLDIGSTADLMRFAYKPVTGDFDARVRVTSFVGVADHLETTAKALLLVRDGVANNAAGVNVWVTPNTPGDNTFNSSARSAAAAATNSLSASVVGANIPNAWLRIKREGNVFTTYRSSDGNNWVEMGTTTLGLNATLNVGLGVVSHRNGKSVSATFSGFTTDGASVVPPTPPVLFNTVIAAGNFSASLSTQNGVNYKVQSKSALGLPSWSDVTTIAGDGSVKSFSEPTASSPTGFRFFRVIVE